MPTLGARVVIAGTHSGVGKTTIATGLMAAFARRGLTVAAAKVGPDFIDPGYHALATGRPSRNLDAWMCGAEVIPALAARAGTGADVLVVEGVMGLFDGASDSSDGSASTAHVAALLGAPVVLVVDAAAMSGSVAALVHGFVSFDSRVHVAGVVLNRVGSDGHEAMLRQSLSPLGVPVLGVLRREDALVWRDRHLGLVPVVEHVEDVRRSLERLSTRVADGCDLDAIAAVAATSEERVVAEPPSARPQGAARVAIASGSAFSFVYPDNLEAVERAGGELVPFDPMGDRALPAGVDALYAGGGFPEVFVERLADNEPLLRDVRTRVRDGLVTWAECGGLLWLARSLEGQPLCGVIDADATMTDRLTLGYRRATAAVDNPVAPAGVELRGHEFHYSTLAPGGDALTLEGYAGRGAGGFASSTMLASYLHLHLGADVAPAERFVATAARAR